MMHKKVSIEFHLRESTCEDICPGHLFIRVIHDRKTHTATTPYLLYPYEWDKNKKQIIFPSEDTPRIAYLQKLEQQIQDDQEFFSKIITSLDEEGKFTSFDITSAYRRHKQGNLISSYVKNLCKELIRNKQERTARGYQTVSDALLSFAKDRNLSFEQITPRMIRQFENMMRSKGLTLNTISFYMRNIRAIYNKAKKDGIFQSRLTNPFEHVYTGVQATKKRALTKEEMIKISEFYTNDKELLFAQSIFLFSFYARGMAFVDMAYLKKTDLQGGVLSYKRKKTGQLLEIKVTQAMWKIIEMFQEETKNSIYLLPLIKNGNGFERMQYESSLRLQNKRLKKLARLSGVRKDLSTHVARHTWATIAKEANLPITVISEGLGHSSEKVTSIYLASLDRSVIDLANDEVIRMIKQPI